MTGGYTNHYTNENPCTNYNTHNFTHKQQLHTQTIAPYISALSMHSLCTSYTLCTTSCHPNAEPVALTSLTQTHKPTTDSVSDTTLDEPFTANRNDQIAHRRPHVIQVTCKSQGKKHIRCAGTTCIKRNWNRVPLDAGLLRQQSSRWSCRIRAVFACCMLTVMRVK